MQRLDDEYVFGEAFEKAFQHLNFALKASRDDDNLPETVAAFYLAVSVFKLVMDVKLIPENKLILNAVAQSYFEGEEYVSVGEMLPPFEDDVLERVHEYVTSRIAEFSEVAGPTEIQ